MRLVESNEKVVYAGCPGGVELLGVVSICVGSGR